MLLRIVVSCCGLYLLTYLLHKAYYFLADFTFHKLIRKIDEIVPLPVPEMRK